MRTLAVSLGLSLGACAAVPVGPDVVPLEKLSEKQRVQVEEILADVAARVPLDPAIVQSRAEIYDFLLAEMPFTGGVVRELGRGSWEIFRDPERPDPGVFYVIDPAGMRLRFELILKEETRRIYVTRGIFSMGILPAVRGRTLVVLRAVPEADGLRTDATVYIKVDSGLYSGLSKAARGLLASVVKDRSAYFIRAAQWVAEEAARRPEWLFTQVNGSAKVDQAVLVEFRNRFLK